MNRKRRDEFRVAGCRIMICKSTHAKKAVEEPPRWVTVSKLKGLQTLKESPFWSDAEPCKVLAKTPLVSLPSSPTIKTNIE
jgi:hypothetical protein